MMATLSDSSGQFVATVFDDEPAPQVEAAAKAGGCGLLTSSSTAAPARKRRGSPIKRFQPLERLAKRTRLQIDVRVADAALIAPSGARAGGGARRQRRGPLHRPDRGGGEAILLVGRDFCSTPSSPPASSASPARAASTCRVQEPPKLALVGCAAARPSRNRRG